ncbi:MAG: hypothetical protein GF331_04295 [Chitinivibrionales bacterium]|nr:hypothetical protein [Chitinivibrionales bacterium]
MEDDAQIVVHGEVLETGGDVFRMLFTHPSWLWREARGLMLGAVVLELFLGVAFSLIILLLLGTLNAWTAPAAYLSLSRWELGRGAVMGNEGEPVLVLEALDNPGGWVAYNRVLCVRLRDGVLLGQRIESRTMQLIGTSRGIVWVKSDYAQKKVRGLTVPRLRVGYDALKLAERHQEIRNIVKEIRVDGDALRVYALDGYQYRLSPPADELARLPLDPPPPEPVYPMAVGEGCTIHGGYLCDYLRGGVPEFGLDRIARRYVGNSGTLILAREGALGGEEWLLSEHELVGRPRHNDIARTLCFSTFLADTAIVVITEEWDKGDLFVCAVDVKRGNVCWRVRLRRGPFVTVRRYAG